MNHGSSRKFFLPVATGILMVLFGGCSGGEETYRHEAPPQERTFAMLNDYGTWIDVPEFGTVWRPRVANEWRPYAYGRWEW